MSRRSLRLNDGLLDRSLPQGSASFSVGGPSWRSSRSLKYRGPRQLSISCSESLLMKSPQKLNSSDASLLSSLVEDSSIHENTLSDSFWGLDHDMDPKENTIVAEQSTVLADHTLLDPDDCDARQPIQPVARFYCQDCEPNTKESVCPASCSLSSSRSVASGEPEISTIYSRGRKRKTHRRVLASAWSGLTSCVGFLLLLLQKRCGAADVLHLCSDRCLLAARRAAVCCVFLFSRIWRVCRGLPEVQAEGTAGAPAHHCGVMNLTGSRQNQDLHPHGSLCDGCEERRRSEALPSPWRPSAASVWALAWNAASVTGDTSARVFRWFRRPRATSDLLTWPVLVLLPLLLLLSLCWFSPAVLWSLLPAAGTDDAASPLSQWGRGEARERLHGDPPAEAAAATVEKEESRLERLEQSVAALWEQVEAGGRRAEQRHGEVMKLYAEVLQGGGGGGGGAWLTGLMERQLQRFRTLLEQKTAQVGPVPPPPERGSGRTLTGALRSETSRLEQLELQLQALAARTEGLTPPTGPPPLLDHVLAQVGRLEAALEDVGRDVAGCRDVGGRLDGIQEAVSSQIRDEVQARIYGSQLAGEGGASSSADAAESLLQWLSQRFLSGADLRAALASLEVDILHNISRRLEGNVAAATPGAAVTREDVHAIVEDTLRLFSEDRTGMADFALESGGGSILSTRCSETYRTKVALLSLFGLPLWYYSQSPRAVIQPDVHPGNCWAFRGSTGFLVIRLSMPVFPTAVTVEHTPRALTPGGTMHSAPRDFSVHGLDYEDQEEGHPLGTYTYDRDGDAVQTFAFVGEARERPFQLVEFRVTSNWGQPDYTCLYRVRVHGTPADT